MNTMADGARDRLVEQIGEALFGQPGLTLMELAEKVKGMNLQTAHAAYKTGKAIGRREAELEAAARQPVGENPAWRDELVREAYNRGLADGLNADRQQVGK